LIILINWNMRAIFKLTFKPIVVILFTFVFNSSNAQIVLKNYINTEQYSNYSKMIEFMQENVDLSNDTLTLFIAPNFAIASMDEAKVQKIFTAKENPDYSEFINNYSTSGFYPISFYKNNLNSNLKDNKIVFRSGNSNYYSLNGDNILISNHFDPVLVSA